MYDRRMGRAVVVVMVLASFARGAAADDDMRCKGGLVSVGDREEVVQRKCGAPTASETRTDHSWIHGVSITTVVDTWTYDRGRRELVRVLTFSDGVLGSIELGDYGKAAVGAAAAPGAAAATGTGM